MKKYVYMFPEGNGSMRELLGVHAYIRKVLADKFGAAAAECPILYGG